MVKCEAESNIEGRLPRRLDLLFLEPNREVDLTGVKKLTLLPPDASSDSLFRGFSESNVSSKSVSENSTDKKSCSLSKEPLSKKVKEHLVLI